MDTQGASSTSFKIFEHFDDMLELLKEEPYFSLAEDGLDQGIEESYNSSMDTQGESSKFFYDVFLSFSGKNTRQTFVAHLFDRLRRHGYQIFKDDKSLRVGDVISTALEKAIEESRISIVVLSTNYASSSWCLDELVKILECKNKLRQRVMPVFYDVLPTQVRHQTGEFGKEFRRLKKRCGAERMDKWAAALTEVANLSGSELQNGDESEFIGKIIEAVKKEVNHTPLDVASYPVGVDSRAKHIIESLLQNGHEDEVRMFGIYGVGGIGKTTLAKEIYNRLVQSVIFDGSCFLSDVRSGNGESRLRKLQQKLLNILLKTKDEVVSNVDEGITIIRRRLRSMKVLIVLDDVDHVEQLKYLAREKSWFGSGSMIIITTRDMKVLRHYLGEEERYPAKLLNEDEAQQLFYWHAFNSLSPPQEYVELAQAIIKYSRGLPLAIVILGSHLRGESIEDWRRDLNKLTGPTPHTDIQKILKISFDGLDGGTQSVFLDIACTFRYFFEFEVIKILDACGFDAESEIATLVQKQLLQKDGSQLRMHHLVRDMAREIVRSESDKYPGERSRLFIPEEVCAVLRAKSGTEKVEVLRLDRPGELGRVSTDAFEPMKKLRVLIINGLRIHGDFELFSKELKWLSWQECPLVRIPSNFPAANLVVLDMSQSHMKVFGLNLQCCPMLKELYLSFCWELSKTPNFNGAQSLKTLHFEGCFSLKEIDQSICQLKSLQVLDISGCNSLGELPIGLGDVQSLRSLRAGGTGIKQLPEFVEKLSNLTTLEVGSKCLQPNQGRVIKSLSTSLSCLALGNFSLSKDDFQVDIGSLSSLKTLCLWGNSFHCLPFDDFSKLRFLTELSLNDCENLQTLPSVSNLENLRILGLRNCKKLVNITGLDNLLSLRQIDMVNCNSLQNPFNEDFFSALAPCIRKSHENLDIKLQCNEIPDWCSNKVTAPSICFTMPTIHNEYKFLGMFLWLVWGSCTSARFIVAVSNREGISMSRNCYANIFIEQSEVSCVQSEVSCVYYVSCLHRPFDGLMIKGGEEITVVKKGYDNGIIEKIGIHLLYSDQQGNVTSLPEVVDHSYTAYSEGTSAGHINSNNNIPAEIPQVDPEGVRYEEKCVPWKMFFGKISELFTSCFCIGT